MMKFRVISGSLSILEDVFIRAAAKVQRERKEEIQVRL
jgi:hypothetical protein